MSFRYSNLGVKKDVNFLQYLSEKKPLNRSERTKQMEQILNFQVPTEGLELFILTNILTKILKNFLSNLLTYNNFNHCKL